MNDHLFSRHSDCRISDAFRYNGLRLIVLENELLQVFVLPEKGAEIAALRYKPIDLDPLLHLQRGPIHPGPFPVTIPSREGAFLDAYQGGWQELFPSAGGPCEVAGAELGVHGEACLLPWNWEIIDDDPQKVAIHFWLRTQRTPFLLERTMSLRTGKAVLELDERITNIGGVEMPFLWGHHPAFGPPFLEEGCRLDTPGGMVEVHGGPNNPKHRLISGQRSDWPEIVGNNEKAVDLRKIPDVNGGTSDMLYLTGLSKGWCALSNPRLGVGIALAWPVKVFPYLWIWQEFCGSRQSPWFGHTAALGLEPCSGYTTIPPSGLVEVMRAGREMVLPAGGQLKAWLKAIIFPTSSDLAVNDVSPDGELTLAKIKS